MDYATHRGFLARDRNLGIAIDKLVLQSNSILEEIQEANR
jgi:hypothetical protein